MDSDFQSPNKSEELKETLHLNINYNLTIVSGERLKVELTDFPAGTRTFVPIPNPGGNGSVDSPDWDSSEFVGTIRHTSLLIVEDVATLNTASILSVDIVADRFVRRAQR